MRGLRKAGVVSVVLLVAVLAQVPAMAGSPWVKHAGQNPAGTASGDINSLHSVSCWTQIACMAVGDYGTQQPSQTLTSAFAERWNGRSWRSTAAASDPDANRSELDSVSCLPSAAWCAAVGWADNGPLAEHWDGASWTVDDITYAPGAESESLSDVSCKGPSACVAVGNVYPFSGGQGTVAYRWDGTTWSSIGPPNAAQAVTCASANSCNAVGTDSSYHVLAYHWNGTAWKKQTIPTPSTTNAVYMHDIDCVAGWCGAVGYYYTNKGYEHTLFLVYNNGWRRVTSPQPAEPGSAHFDGLECPSPGFCVIVGGWAPPSTQTGMPVAKRWRGGKGFTAIGLDSTGIASSFGLAGVSCVDVRCYSVGDYYNSDAALVALIESGAQPVG